MKDRRQLHIKNIKEFFDKYLEKLTDRQLNQVDMLIENLTLFQGVDTYGDDEE